MNNILNIFCFIFLSVNVYAAYEYTGAYNSYIKINEDEFCIRINPENTSLMKVLPINDKITYIELDTGNGLERPDICSLGLLYTDDNKAFFDKNSYEIVIKDIKKINFTDIDKYLAGIFSGFNNPHCKYVDLYRKGIDWSTNYDLYTIQCSGDKEDTAECFEEEYNIDCSVENNDIEKEQRLIEVSVVQETKEVIELFSAMGTVVIMGTAVIAGGVVCLFFKSPALGAGLSKLGNRLSSYLSDKLDGLRAKAVYESISSALKAKAKELFSVKTLWNTTKWVLDTMSKGVVMYIVGAELYSYGNTGINKLVDPEVAYKEINEESGYKLLPINNQVYVTTDYVEMITKGAYYAEEGYYSIALSAFVHAARIAILYPNPAFSETIIDQNNLIPGLRVILEDKKIDLLYQSSNGADIDFTIKKVGVNEFMVIDHKRNDEIFSIGKPRYRD